MKTFLSMSLLAAMGLSLSGCLVIGDRAPRTVVVDNGPVVRETTITTLPSGYRTRVYRGSTYYYRGSTVYRTHPSGGYVTVVRPWR